MNNGITVTNILPTEKDASDMGFSKINKNSNVLDIGSGKGHHVNHYQKSGIKIQGLDKSDAMVKCSRKKSRRLESQKSDFFRDFQSFRSPFLQNKNLEYFFSSCNIKNNHFATNFEIESETN